jgi:hypothetical protein
MGTEPFSGVKRPGLGIDHPPPSNAEVRERVELYIYSLSGPSWPVLGGTLPLLLPTKFYEFSPTSVSTLLVSGAIFHFIKHYEQNLHIFKAQSIFSGYKI